MQRPKSGMRMPVKTAFADMLWHHATSVKPALRGVSFWGPVPFAVSPGRSPPSSQEAAPASRELERASPAAIWAEQAAAQYRKL